MMTTVEEDLLFAVLSGDCVLALSLSLLFTEGSRSSSGFIFIFTEIEFPSVTVHLLRQRASAFFQAFYEAQRESLAVHNIWQ